MSLPFDLESFGHFPFKNVKIRKSNRLITKRARGSNRIPFQWQLADKRWEIALLLLLHSFKFVCYEYRAANCWPHSIWNFSHFEPCCFNIRNLILFLAWECESLNRSEICDVVSRKTEFADWTSISFVKRKKIEEKDLNGRFGFKISLCDPCRERLTTVKCGNF